MHKDKLQINDVVMTGSGSFLVFQLGAESLVQVEPNTTITLASIMDKGETALALGQGKIFSNIRRLQKSESFTVRMKTSTAAVRGTEFSVAYSERESVVAVNRGVIAVQQVGDNNEIKEEKSVENGNVAVVKDTITSRPLNSEEEKELVQFERITPMADVEGASETDLKKKEDDLIKSKGMDKTDEVKTRGVEKSGKVKKAAGKEKKSEPIVEAKKPLTNNNKTDNGAAWTEKRVYALSEPVIVHYKNLPQNRNCWISISKAGSPDRSHESYHWTYSAKDGSMDFSKLKLEPGAYEVRVHFYRGNEVNLRYGFTVK